MINYSYRQYVQVVNGVLSVIADTLQAKNVSISVSNGREASTLFERDLKELITLHKDSVFENLTSSVPLGWKVLDIDSSLLETEASKRELGDLYLIIERPDGRVITEAINIKVTNGKSFDNVGGWGALYLSLFGEINKSAKEKDVVKKLRDIEGFDNVPYDYFLWVFKKFDNSKDILNSAQSFAFLDLPFDSFCVNISQSFPLQYKAPSKEINSLKSNNTALTEDKSCTNRRNDFVSFFFNNVAEKREKKFLEAKNIANKFS